MLLVSYSATATASPLTGSWFQPGSGSGSSSVALKCCTNNAAKLNESRKRAGWVAVAVERSPFEWKMLGTTLAGQST